MRGTMLLISVLFVSLIVHIPPSKCVEGADGVTNVWALIVSGGINLNFPYTAYYLYYALFDGYGMNHDQIHYLVRDSSHQFGIAQMDGIATKENVRNAITDWLKNKADGDDIILIYVTCHGGGFNSTFKEDGEPFLNGGGRIDGSQEDPIDEKGEYQGEHKFPNGTWFGVDECLRLEAGDDHYYYDDELEQDLNQLNYGTLITIFQTCVGENGTCYSGGFIDDLSDTNRIIITASNETGLAYMDLDYLAGNVDGFMEFSEVFIDALYGWNTTYSEETEYLQTRIKKENNVDADFDDDGSVSIWEAWKYAWQNDDARLAVRTVNGTIQDPWNSPDIDETPWYDDDGDGLPTIVDDSYHPDEDGYGDLGKQTFLINYTNKVDLSAVSIEPTTPQYPVVQVYDGGMRWCGENVSMSFNVTVSRNDTYTEPAIIHNASVTLKRTNATGTESVIVDYDLVGLGLGPCTVGPVPLTWNETETMQQGNWTISAFVSPPEGYYDENITNNEVSDGVVEAKELVGDIDGSGEVDIFDAVIFGPHLGCESPWNHSIDPFCDLNEDNIIDMYDAIIFAAQFGESLGCESGSSSGCPIALSVYPAETIINEDEIFSANITVTNATDLYGYELKLYYNNTILNCTGTEFPAGHLLEPNDPQNLWIIKQEINNNYNSTHGRIWLAISLLTPETGKTGNGTLAKINFKALTPGTTTLSLQDVKLADSEAQPIQTETINSLVKVNHPPQPPSSGPTLFVWNGDDYVDYGVIDIHDASGEDVIREVSITKQDLAVEDRKVKLRLQEGWEGLNFSESVIDQVKLYVIDEDGKLKLCPLTSAVHSRLGNVREYVVASDDYKAQMLLLETIDLTFKVREDSQGFVFVLEGCNMLKM